MTFLHIAYLIALPCRRAADLCALFHAIVIVIVIKLQRPRYVKWKLDGRSNKLRVIFKGLAFESWAGACSGVVPHMRLLLPSNPLSTNMNHWMRCWKTDEFSLSLLRSRVPSMRVCSGSLITLNLLPIHTFSFLTLWTRVVTICTIWCNIKQLEIPTFPNSVFMCSAWFSQ
jgi:hypothetical protein